MCALFLSLVTHRVSHNTHTHERVCCVSVRACAVRVCGADVYRSGFKRGYGGKRVLRSQVPVGRRDAQYTRDTYVRVIVSCCASSGCERCCYHGCTRRWCEGRQLLLLCEVKGTQKSSKTLCIHLHTTPYICGVCRCALPMLLVRRGCEMSCFPRCTGVSHPNPSQHRNNGN